MEPGSTQHSLEAGRKQKCGFSGRELGGSKNIDCLVVLDDWDGKHCTISLMSLDCRRKLENVEENLAENMQIPQSQKWWLNQIP